MELCVIFFAEINENERKTSKFLLFFTRLIVTLSYKLGSKTIGSKSGSNKKEVKMDNTIVREHSSLTPLAKG